LWLEGCAALGGAAKHEAGHPGEAPAPDGESAPAGKPDTTPEMRTITGEVTAISEDVAGLVAAIRAHAVEVGGSIAREDMSGDAQHRQAATVVRLPPAAVTPFIDWMGARATLDARHFEVTEVTRQYFDREVAIRNLEVTLERLRELARRPDGDLAGVMEVEREMTRVRGELEKLRGEQRLLADQVARATLTITISGKPDEHFTLVPHMSYLHLFDAGTRAADRTGGGVALMFTRAAGVDFEVFPGRGGDPRSYLFTFAAAGYSNYLGGGARRFGNPYLGVRLGGAKMNGLGAFAYGVDAGVELVRYKLFHVEVSGRAIGLWYNRDSGPNSDLLVEATVGVGVPF
jgi:hypothetical protein